MDISKRKNSKTIAYVVSSEVTRRIYESYEMEEAKKDMLSHDELYAIEVRRIK